MSAKQTVVTFGSFDFFHYGHYRILERAAALGTRLVVGLSSDAFHFQKKQRRAVCNWQERAAVLSNLRFVDHVFREDSLAEKRRYLLEHHADILVMGDDWQGRFDEFLDICKVVYLARTDGVSTTDILKIGGRTAEGQV